MARRHSSRLLYQASANVPIYNHFVALAGCWMSILGVFHINMRFGG